MFYEFDVLHPGLQLAIFFERFKVEMAKLDGSGANPTDVKCFVVEISYTSQTATILVDTTCDSIPDLQEGAA